MQIPTPLIDREDFTPWKDVSQFKNWDYMERHIRNVQESYLRPLLGDALYESIQETYPDPIVEELRDDYVKVWLVFLSYAESKKDAGVFDTTTGPQIFRHDYSEPVPEKRLEKMIRDANFDANNYLTRLRGFLKTNAEVLGWIDPQNCETPKGKATFGISAIRPPKPDEQIYLL